jgi:hypothetical protein
MEGDGSGHVVHWREGEGIEEEEEEEDEVSTEDNSLCSAIV